VIGQTEYPFKKKTEVPPNLLSEMPPLVFHPISNCNSDIKLSGATTHPTRSNHFLQIKSFHHAIHSIP
jgi:hypothetical protein